MCFFPALVRGLDYDDFFFSIFFFLTVVAEVS